MSRRKPGPLSQFASPQRVVDGTINRQVGVRPSPITPTDRNGLTEFGNRAQDVKAVWDRAVRRYLWPAVTAKVNEDFADILRTMLPGLILALGAYLSAVGGGMALGATLGGVLGEGVGAIPGAVLGAQVGSELALFLLDWLGLSFLVVYIDKNLGEVRDLLQQSVTRAWESNGAPAAVDAAARQMAAGLAMLFSLVVQGLAAAVAQESLASVASKLEKTAFGSRLAKWLAQNKDRLEQEGPAQGNERNPALLRTASGQLPDVSHRFRFQEFTRDGKSYKQASGELGAPGKVRQHRSTSAQQGVSAGTGDDAGHLIGNRFGAPGDARNLSLQNWRSNRFGTYKDLENFWAEKLKAGTRVEVTVTDVTRPGEDRPFMREVKWTEILPNGSRSGQELTFANTHTPQSRTAQGVAPTVNAPQENNVINVDFPNKKRLP